MRNTLDEAAILRVLRCLLANELQSGRLDRDEGGLALEGRNRIACATAVSTFFHLHDAGMEDDLLAEATLGGWAGIVRAALIAGTPGITVHTSGSTGTPCPCTHTWERLDTELDHWATLLGERRRVVQLVASHHIYGCIFTVLLPARLGIEVLDLRAFSPDEAASLLTEDDLVVATPPQLAGLASRMTRAPEGIVLVSAGAPLRWEVADALYEAGAAVHDIYGSSETGGVAVRTHPATWHRLLPFWRGGQGGDSASVVSAWGVATPLPDRVVWKGPDTLRLDGRKDAAVRVGDANVYPSRVAASLAEHPLVAECTVRLDTTLAAPRLKALVVPRAEAPSDASRLVATLEAFCRERFTTAERPVRIDIAANVPRSTLGKPLDWTRAA